MLGSRCRKHPDIDWTHSYGCTLDQIEFALPSAADLRFDDLTIIRKRKLQAHIGTQRENAQHASRQALAPVGFVSDVELMGPGVSDRRVARGQGMVVQL